MIHNLSKPFSGSWSLVKSILIDDKIQVCMYGHCLLGQSIFGDMSEIATDLANTILCHPHWSLSKNHSSLHSKVPPDNNLPPNIPFAQALHMIVDPEKYMEGIIDVYISDKTTVTVDLPDNRERARVA